jgi:hypothetical protein
MIENIAVGMGFVVLFALMAYGVVAYFKYIR